MDNLGARFIQLKEKKTELERNIMESNVRLESLQKQLKDAMATLQEKYGVDNLDDAMALLNEKDLEYSRLAKELEDKISEYENSVK